MDNADAADQEKLTLVAQAIAKAMGHEERWHTYLAVARMHISGYAACQKIERIEANNRAARSLRKR